VPFPDSLAGFKGWAPGKGKGGEVEEGRGGRMDTPISETWLRPWLTDGVLQLLLNTNLIDFAILCMKTAKNQVTFINIFSGVYF